MKKRGIKKRCEAFRVTHTQTHLAAVCLDLNTSRNINLKQDLETKEFLEYGGVGCTYPKQAAALDPLPGNGEEEHALTERGSLGLFTELFRGKHIKEGINLLLQEVEEISSNDPELWANTTIALLQLWECGFLLKFSYPSSLPPLLLTHSSHRNKRVSTLAARRSLEGDCMEARGRFQQLMDHALQAMLAASK
ncbi:hypothetical protein AOLI_G00182430 [Acnodon oligacanthus]